MEMLVAGQQLYCTSRADRADREAMDIATLPRRTQAQRREESDGRLLAAAAEIIAEEGYLAATLERVGERAGFSRGLAGRKYGSKDGLIEAVIRHVSIRVHAEVDRATAGIADPLERLLALFDRFVELAEHDVPVRAYFVLFSAMLANRLETRATFDEIQQRFGERIETLVIEAQVARRIPPALPAQHVAYMIGCLLAGLAIESAVEAPQVEDPAALRADIRALLRRALGD
jgi:AcrR family transcriptional regulator